MPRQDYRQFYVSAVVDSDQAYVSARIKRANEVPEIDGDDTRAITVSGIPFLAGTSRLDLLNAYAAKMDFRRAYKLANPDHNLDEAAPGEP